MAAADAKRNDFQSRAMLAATLSDIIADRLDAAVRQRGKALLAVSGGSTPGLLFDNLADADIEWGKIVVTLVDERYVPDTSPRSNAALVKSRLLQRRAAKAKFLPLYQPDRTVAAAADLADSGLRLLGLPLDVVVLGMGNDGHTASFFPDAAELAQLLDPANPRLVSSVNAPSAGEPRLTMTLPPIAAARFVALHIEGDEKAATLDKALSPNSTLPVRRVMDATPVEIFWAA